MLDGKWLDISICVVYLLIVFGIGVWCARGSKDNEEYFVGGRRMHWLPIGLSLFAGTFSALSFVGLPREAAYDDHWQFFIAILFIAVVVTPIVGWLFLPLYFRLNVTSCYEYLELRFSRPLRLAGNLLYSVYTVLWMGNMLVAVGKILQVVMDLSNGQLRWMLVGIGLFATFYTSIGGVKAVVWTDALQAFALGLGMAVILFVAVSEVSGGWPEVLRIAQTHEKFTFARLPSDWTDLVKGTNVFAVASTGFFVYLAGHAVHLTSVQRYVSMSSIAAARKSLVVNAVMVVVVCGVFFLVGTVLFTYYSQSGDPTYAQLHLDEKEDQLLPRFIMDVVPQFGLAGLLLAGLFAAAMSSLDSGINSLTAGVVCDWQSGRTHSVWESRIWTGLFGIAAVVAALVLREYGGNVFRVLMVIAGSFLGMILGTFLLGLMSRRANALGAIIGLAAGLATVASAMYFKVGELWYGAISCLTTLGVGYIASFLAPPPLLERLRGLSFFGDAGVTRDAAAPAEP